MPRETDVVAHYGRPGLEADLLRALEAAGLDLAALTPAALAPVDEFHVGGREATLEFAQGLELGPDLSLLDIGAGIGGPARTLAAEFGCRVTGIDLTPGFVAVAESLTRRAGLGERVAFEQASATALPFPDASFERATLIHVGMNLPDKPAVFGEVRRVLAPGGLFGLYEIMRTGQGEPDFPVPWAGRPEQSFLATPDAYRAGLRAAGFELLRERDRGTFAREFFARMRARAEAEGPPILGLHILFGPAWAERVANFVAALEKGTVIPVEIIARAA